MFRSNFSRIFPGFVNTSLFSTNWRVLGDYVFGLNIFLCVIAKFNCRLVSLGSVICSNTYLKSDSDIHSDSLVVCAISVNISLRCSFIFGVSHSAFTKPSFSFPESTAFFTDLSLLTASTSLERTIFMHNYNFLSGVWILCICFFAPPIFFVNDMEWA